MLIFLRIYSLILLNIYFSFLHSIQMTMGIDGSVLKDILELINMQKKSRVFPGFFYCMRLGSA